MELRRRQFLKEQLNENKKTDSEDALSLFYFDRIEYADKMGLDVFGIGEHHRKDFLDSAPTLILAAAAGENETNKTNQRCYCAERRGSGACISKILPRWIYCRRARAEIVAGRGSFVEAYPLFGLNLNDYEMTSLKKNLNCCLKSATMNSVTWSEKFRPALKNQAVYPRPLQKNFTHLAGCGWNSGIFCKSRTDGSAFDGSYYRW